MPPPRLHLIHFNGVLAPNATLAPAINRQELQQVLVNLVVNGCRGSRRRAETGRAALARAAALRRNSLAPRMHAKPPPTPQELLAHVCGGLQFRGDGPQFLNRYVFRKRPGRSLNRVPKWFGI